jgi:1-acyl-sn-glycerol-3-phosphate acyltransferase
LLLRLPERAIWGAGASGHTVDHARRLYLDVLVPGPWARGVGHSDAGTGAYVANHSSWLDILVLNASKRMYFVAKAEVAGWGGIGWLARGTGTVFVRRDRAEAAKQANLFEARLKAGHRLMFFPEGTSTDGRQRAAVSRPTLFAAFFDDGAACTGMHASGGQR